MNWNEVFQLPAIEFLTYILFHNYKVRKQERKMEEFRRKTKR